jgi:hypothetical protein
MNQGTSSFTLHWHSDSGWQSMIDQKLTEVLESQALVLEPLEPSLRLPLTSTLLEFTAEEESSDIYPLPAQVGGELEDNWHHLILPVMDINCHIG